MTNTLRQQAHGALAVLNHTSHQDKANILIAYVDSLEVQSRIALERTAMLGNWGWQLSRKRSSRTLWLRHPRSFYEVNLKPNGDAEFRLMRVKNSHWIGAEDKEAFEGYLHTVDRGDRGAIQVAKWCIVGASAVWAAVALLMIGN